MKYKMDTSHTNNADEILLSFIVPVYNVRDYVIRCLVTLTKQNIPQSDYEIIVVIDGSPDDSLDLVSKFAEVHNNIVIIDQENMGLSEARNQGFKRAKGKYVWFIDSDDWITENCVKELLSIMEQNNLDMFEVAPSISAQSDFNLYFNKANSLSPVFTGKEGLIHSLCVVGAWCYIYRSEFLKKHQLTFAKGLYYEDEEFTSRALYFAERVMTLLNFSVYFYFIREGSIMHTLSDKKIFDRLKIAKLLADFSKNTILIEEKSVKKCFDKKVADMTLTGINDICKSKSGKDFLYKYIEDAQTSGLFPMMTKSFNFKRIVLVKLCNFSPLLYYFLRSFNQRQTK